MADSPPRSGTPDSPSGDDLDAAQVIEDGPGPESAPAPFGGARPWWSVDIGDGTGPHAMVNGTGPHAMPRNGTGPHAMPRNGTGPHAMPVSANGSGAMPVVEPRPSPPCTSGSATTSGSCCGTDHAAVRRHREHLVVRADHQSS
ncbi:hypothetical protein ABWI04_12605, partial [Actinomadura sp. NPDC000929]